MQRDGSMYNATNRYYYLHDRLGSERMLIDADAAVQNCYTFDPWGNIFDNELEENVSNPYRFAGYLWDDETGMANCNARIYDPVIGRFTSRDPVRGSFREPMTLHAYLYCADDPINRIDPTGEFTFSELKTSMGIQGGLSSWLGQRLLKGVLGGIQDALISGAITKSKGEGFWKGATSGFISGSVPAFLGATGIAASFISGGISGFYSAYQDQRRIEEMLISGTIGALYGGAFYQTFSSKLTVINPASTLDAIKDYLAGTAGGAVGGNVSDAFMEIYYFFKEW